MIQTTPTQITPEIKSFAAELGCTDIEFVEVHPDQDAKAMRCFLNIQAKIGRDGGSLVHGWAFWEHPKLFVDAEFHGCWRDPSGKLIDLTPHSDGEATILFAVDPKRIYEARNRPSIVRALNSAPEVRTFVELANAYNKYISNNTLPDVNYVPTDRMLKLGGRVNEARRAMMKWADNQTL